MKQNIAIQQCNCGEYPRAKTNGDNELKQISLFIHFCRWKDIYFSDEDKGSLYTAQLPSGEIV